MFAFGFISALTMLLMIPFYLQQNDMQQEEKKNSSPASMAWSCREMQSLQAWITKWLTALSDSGPGTKQPSLISKHRFSPSISHLWHGNDRAAFVLREVLCVCPSLHSGTDTMVLDIPRWAWPMLSDLSVHRRCLPSPSMQMSPLFLLICYNAFSR